SSQGRPQPPPLPQVFLFESSATQVLKFPLLGPLKHSQIPSSRICPPSSSINHLKSCCQDEGCLRVPRTKTRLPRSHAVPRKGTTPLSSRVPLPSPHTPLELRLCRSPTDPSTCPVMHLICRRTRNVRASFSFLLRLALCLCTLPNVSFLRCHM
ncbi:hypothetical protein B0H14DRAFT_3072588, partial [Mycena olivaceomarginata]